MTAARFSVINAAAPDLASAFRRVFGPAGNGPGVYLLVDKRRFAGVRTSADVIKALLRHPDGICYIGGSVNLRARVRSLLRSLDGNHKGHHIGRTLSELDGAPDKSDLLVVIVRFWAVTPLETFLVDEVARNIGDYPLANLRRPHRTSGRSRLRRAQVSWERLGLKVAS